MKVVNVTIANYLDCDKVLVHTDVPEPETLGLMTFHAETKPGKGEVWARNNFGDVAIKVIDRRKERG